MCIRDSVWELYILLQIKLYTTGSASNQDSYNQNVRMLIGTTQVFNLSFGQREHLSSPDNDYNGKTDINLQCSNNINEAVCFTRTVALFDVSGNDQDNTTYPSIVNHENDHHTDTDLASRTIKVQVKNNTSSGDINHRFRGIVVEKATVDNQHRQYYPPI